jgi:electron-transferring-flavoprotein dehydrogenase
VSEREQMDFDAVIVGAGPCGLSAAIRLMQLGKASGQEMNICVVEKAAEVGGHILSGAVLETTALDELFPNWKEMDAPIKTEVADDDFYFMSGPDGAIKVPNLFIPSPMHNKGNYIVSLGEVCRWLGDQAESMGVNIFPGFPASDVIIDEGKVAGVITGDMGIAKDGQQKPSFEAGYELRAPLTIFAEGCRGSLGKKLESEFQLRVNCDPQHYGIGIKEVWEISPDKHEAGKVVHSFGWPMDSHTEGGGFLYHAKDNLVYCGFITALNYSNPNINPYKEFQRWKHNPKISQYLTDGKRISYGARAVNKGGLQSLPQLSFPGGLLAGCEAGFLNGAKIKGSHTAMKTGMLAAESVFEKLQKDEVFNTGDDYLNRINSSWVYDELWRARNYGPILNKFGTLIGSPLIWIDQTLFRGKLPFTMSHSKPDYDSLINIKKASPIDYPAPDGKLSFDLLSSVYLSSTNHEEDQPVHLRLKDASIPLDQNLPKFGEPATRYCPAGVYEIIEEAGQKQFKINAQNCVHCKTCDIKDPSQNIDWSCPEGGGGPNYSGM